jgi:pilus assembly protein CpaF
MKLSERLMQIDEAPATVRAEPNGSGNGERPRLAEDPLAEFKAHAREALFGKLQARSIDASMDDQQLRGAVMAELQRLMADSPTPLTPEERERISAEISEDIVGYGPVGRFLDDDSVTEVMVNGTSGIFVERNGRITRTDTRFASEEHLRHIIDRIVSRIGRRIDESSPMVDARLPDGSRVNAVIPPLAVDGPSLTIRKFSRDPYGVEDLIEFGTMTAAMATLLRACVEGKLNMLITGGTGTGKTTLLNVLSSFIPHAERIVTIEDAVELQLRHDDLVRLESRPPNVERRGEVTIRDLVRNALRMRPDRIVVGEVRGPEALDMLQAMNTGHEGSLSTLHANSPRDAMNRLETMVLMAGVEIPIAAIRDYVSSALSVIVHLSRMRDGTRRITQVTEVVGMEGDIITMQDIFRFRFQGVDEQRRIVGQAEPTGIRPKFADHFKAMGVTVPTEVFGADGERLRAPAGGQA